MDKNLLKVSAAALLLVGGMSGLAYGQTNSDQPLPKPGSSGPSDTDAQAGGSAGGDATGGESTGGTDMEKPSDTGNSGKMDGAKPDSTKSGEGLKGEDQTRSTSGTSDEGTKSGASSTEKTGTEKTGSEKSSTEEGGAKTKATTDESSGGKASKEAGKASAVKLSTEQRTEIRQKIVTKDVERVHVDFDVSVGVHVPRRIELHTLPAEVITIVPEYRGYSYFVLADGRIVIVDPDTYTIVTIIVV